MSEDCLFVDVYMPTGPAPPGGFPVLFWIYPGGFIFGTGGFVAWDMYFDVVAAAEPVAIVTTAYRVAGMGFFAGDPLRADSPDGSVGNYGLQDQRAALQWVHDNAAAFGFNKNKVTIWGVSAGGASVSHLLADPRAYGLFSGAIVESGAMAEWISFSYNETRDFYPKFAADAGCPTGGPESLACLRAISWENITLVNTIDFLSLDRWGPVVDGVEVPDFPRAMAARGQLAPNVSVLIGSNADEGTLFAVPQCLDLGMNTSAAYLACLSAYFGGALAPTIAGLYPPADFPAYPNATSSHWQAFARAVGDYMITCPSRDQARWLTSPARAGGARPTWAWQNVHQSYMLGLFFPWTGVMHATDILFVLDMQGLMWGFGEASLQGLWIRYLTRFAAAGDPNGAGDPRWSQYGGAAADLVAVFDTGALGANVTMVQGVRGALCDFWAAHQNLTDGAAPARRARAGARADLWGAL